HQTVVDDHAPKRQQHRLRQDRQVGADQFLEWLGQGQHAVSDRLLIGREEDHVLLQLSKDVELAVNKMLPGAHDVEFITGQVGRVFIDKLLDQVGVAEERIPDLEAHLRRQRRKLVRRGNVIGNHLEALVHEEHQRPVELEKQ